MKLSRSLLSLSLNLFKEHIFFYLGAFACLYATHYVQSNLPFMAKEVADKIAVDISAINLWDFFYTALGIIFFRTFSRLLFFYPARIIQKKLRVEMVEIMERTFPERYKDFPDGQLFQIISGDMEQIRALLGFAYMQIGNVVIALIVLLPKLSKFNSSLIYGLIPMGVAFFIFSFSTVFTKSFYKKNQEASGDLQNYLIESYKGKKSIKNYQAEFNFLNLFKKYSFTELTYFYKGGMIISWAMPLIALGIGLSFVWGAFIIHSQGMDANSLVLYSGFIFLFMEPLGYVSWIGIVFSRSFASWERIKTLVKSCTTKTPKEDKLEKLNEKSSDGEFKVPLWDSVIDLNITDEKKLSIVGETGSGKTEFLKNFAQICLMKDYKVSYVAQNPYLYNDSILNNIFLGREFSDREKEQAKELLVLFELNILSFDLDDLLRVQVGENGKELSGGQVKRLCLIRSIFAPARIIIWDDPFSSVDLILEREIFKKLDKHYALKDKSIVFSTHRLSTFKYSENFIFIEKEKGELLSGDVVNNLEKRNQVYEFFEKQMV
ncbi:ABC transporter ATP-binding protein/permease [bacterium]|nr:ABC transporter ATP-binding protein/permease [bacterium]